MPHINARASTPISPAGFVAPWNGTRKATTPSNTAYAAAAQCSDTADQTMRSQSGFLNVQRDEIYTPNPTSGPVMHAIHRTSAMCPQKAASLIMSATQTDQQTPERAAMIFGFMLCLTVLFTCTGFLRCDSLREGKTKGLRLATVQISCRVMARPSARSDSR